MKKYFFFLVCMGLSNILTAQNVGIGTATPAEKLDVNGNINVSGTVKANGVDGLPNQVLMKNASGNLAWGDLSEYKNYITFTTPGSNSWTVPAGITKIMVEAWGAGGGATLYGGGGGGAYVAAIFPVTPGGIVFYTVAAGGSPGVSSSTEGGYSGAAFGSLSATAYGGGGLTYTTYGAAAAGGNYAVSAILKSFYYQAGEVGGANKFEYYQSGATAFNESQAGGKGGDAGNSTNTGGKGAYFVRNAITSSIIYNLFNTDGKIPGGGGGGGTPTGGGVLAYGAQGMVIIHY